MAIYSGIFPNNIEYKDLRDTLNFYGGTVGNTSADINKVWSANANINKWSFHKPVRFSKLFNLSNDDFANENIKDGFNIPIFNNVLNLFNNYDPSGWAHLLPRGGAYNEPLRISDYKGYNPNAESFIDSVEKPDFLYKNQQGHISMVFQNVDLTNSFPVELLKAGNYNTLFLGSYYLGMYVQLGTDYNYVCTGNKTLAYLRANAPFVETLYFPAYNGMNATDEFSIAFFLCPEPNINTLNPSQLGTQLVTEFIILPDMPKYTIPMIVMPTINIIVSAVWQDKTTSHSYVDYTIQLDNTGIGSLQSFTNCKIGVLQNDSSWGDPLKEGETVENIADITVLPNENKFITGSVDAAYMEAPGSWDFYFVFNNTSLTYNRVVESIE